MLYLLVLSVYIGLYGVDVVANEFPQWCLIKLYNHEVDLFEKCKMSVNFRKSLLSLSHLLFSGLWFRLFLLLVLLGMHCITRIHCVVFRCTVSCGLFLFESRKSMMLSHGFFTATRPVQTDINLKATHNILDIPLCP